MLEMMKAQRFGVEIEMTGITRAAVADILADRFGTEVSSPAYDGYHTRKVEDRQGRTWKVMRDGSISEERTGYDRSWASDEYKVELVTPPLNYEDIEELQEIVRTIRKAGGKVNSSCGIHVHVDGANHTMESLKRLVNFFVARQDLIYEALNIGGRADRWCRKMSSGLLKQMKKNKANSKELMEKIWYSKYNEGGEGEIESAYIDHSHYNSTRYHGLNLHAFFTKGTVEFRLFNSTLHAGRIKTYIQFCLAISAWAIESDEIVTATKVETHTPEQKVRIMERLLRKKLGFSGDEFKTAKYFLLLQLKKNAGLDIAEAA